MNEKDRAYAIIKGRAESAARKAGETAEFFMTEMNYRSLVPLMRELLSSGLCQNCGHRFADESDIQLVHIAPPRYAQDWARLHTRNLTFFCASCSNTKPKPLDIRLEEQLGTRYLQ